MNTTTNPYRHAARHLLNAGMYVFDRVKWDLTSEAWQSRKRLKELQNTRTGQKAVILCNGPSLLKTDFSLLGDSYTIGLNKINLLFDKRDFRPSCITAVNPHVIEQNKDFYNETSLPLFLDTAGRGQVKFRPNVIFLHTTLETRFAQDVSVSLFQGYTVTFVALQIAFHMGFRDVALVGCDHNFAAKGPANKTVVAEGPDQSHFDPNYFAHGVTWQLPDLAKSEISYILAREAFAVAGGRIVNCTEGGHLNIFERLSLREWLAQSAPAVS